jgi:hypothetical protein
MQTLSRLADLWTTANQRPPRCPEDSTLLYARMFRIDHFLIRPVPLTPTKADEDRATPGDGIPWAKFGCIDSNRIQAKMTADSRMHHRPVFRREYPGWTGRFLFTLLVEADRWSETISLSRCDTTERSCAMVSLRLILVLLQCLKTDLE